MTFIKRAVSGIAVLALLILAARYLPAPISTAAWIILGLLALALFLPLLLALINIVFSSDDDGWFGNILESWFLWTALEWPFTVLAWLFRIGRPDRRRNPTAHSDRTDRSDHPDAGRPIITGRPVAGIAPHEPPATPSPPSVGDDSDGNNLGDDTPEIPSERNRPRRPPRRRTRRRPPRRPTSTP